MSVRPQQRFVIRHGKAIIGEGVITHLLPSQTEEEKMKVMEAKMKKLKLDEKRAPAEQKEEPSCSHSSNEEERTTAGNSEDTEKH
ncbi:unnamed protein product [Cylicocyclus nassatus]|uniref:Uncharacterized protein n=1 Tax=Cylicocyclus nassatus TaxID=53992 RepID=A0AA36M4A1_CYLNA|nr:unnamed protein product [Cylicocyclus nassatus]